MRNKTYLIMLAMLITSPFSNLPALAHGESKGISRDLISSSPLSNIPGNNLTAVTVQLAPGASSPAHRHAGFVFVYVLEGTVRSQLDNADIIDYKKGESWIEPPGTLHSLTLNPSKTENAKVLAVFVAKEGAKLTTSPDGH